MSSSIELQDENSRYKEAYDDLRKKHADVIQRNLQLRYTITELERVKVSVDDKDAMNAAFDVGFNSRELCYRGKQEFEAGWIAAKAK